MSDSTEMLDRRINSPMDRVTALINRMLTERSLMFPASADDYLRSVGLSSLDMVNLVLSVESEFDVSIPDADITPARFRSISTIAALVTALMSAFDVSWSYPLRETMQPDPHVKRLLDMLAAGRTDVTRLSPEAMRQAIDKLAQLVDAKNVSIGAVENREIPGPACGLPIRIYTPVTEMTGRLPGLIYFYGGTGVFCSIETHDGLCRMLANESGCRVVSGGCRPLPRHR